MKLPTAFTSLQIRQINIMNMLYIIILISLGPCSYGQKLPRLARKPFEEFTSEISPCYKNNMKNYIVFIWDKTFPVY